MKRELTNRLYHRHMTILHRTIPLIIISTVCCSRHSVQPMAPPSTCRSLENANSFDSRVLSAVKCKANGNYQLRITGVSRVSSLLDIINLIHLNVCFDFFYFFYLILFLFSLFFYLIDAMELGNGNSKLRKRQSIQLSPSLDTEMGSYGGTANCSANSLSPSSPTGQITSPSNLQTSSKEFQVSEVRPFLFFCLPSSFPSFYCLSLAHVWIVFTAFEGYWELSSSSLLYFILLLIWVVFSWKGSHWPWNKSLYWFFYYIPLFQ